MRGFRRRSVCSGLVASAVVPAAMPAAPLKALVDGENRRHVAAGGMVFRWRHDAAGLQGSLGAPTAGWLAVGFNDAGRLKGTCFVMAQVSRPPGRLELRRARVPDHVLIADPRVQASLAMEGGVFEDGRSTLRFRLPHESGAALGVTLTPGAATHLMLAWSHSTDFGHHSAFRDHQRVVL